MQFFHLKSRKQRTHSFSHFISEYTFDCKRWNPIQIGLSQKLEIISLHDEKIKGRCSGLPASRYSNQIISNLRWPYSQPESSQLTANGPASNFDLPYASWVTTNKNDVWLFQQKADDGCWLAWCGWQAKSVVLHTGLIWGRGHLLEPRDWG